MKKLFIINITILLGMLIFSCEDPIPSDYIEQNILEAYLIVNEPIRGLRLMRTLPVSDTFLLEKSLISDAQVIIREGENSLNLSYSPYDSEIPGYYYADTSYKVKSETEYKLEITLADGSKIFGSTFTPPQTQLIKSVPDFIYFPQDTIKLPVNDSLEVEWQSVPSFGVYGLSIRCLDTLEYGKYLSPQRPEELNRRILKPWSENNDFYENTRWYPVPNTKSPVVWTAFKYYGLHEMAVYVPDFNFLRWFLQNATRGAADELLNSIEGNGFGCFGSISVVRDTAFIVKNQP